MSKDLFILVCVVRLDTARLDNDYKSSYVIAFRFELNIRYLEEHSLTCLIGVIKRKLCLKDDSERLTQLLSGFERIELVDESLDHIVLTGIDIEEKKKVIDGRCFYSCLLLGIVVGLIGEKNESYFEVHSVVYPGWPPQEPLLVQPKKKIMFISGMNIANGNIFDIDILLDYLKGYLGTEKVLFY